MTDESGFGTARPSLLAGQHEKFSPLVPQTKVAPKSSEVVGEQAQYVAKITTSAKGFHSFEVRAGGNTIDEAIDNVAYGAEKLKLFCDEKNALI